MEKKKVELIAVIGIFSLLAVIGLYNFMRLPKSGTAAKKRESPGSYRTQLLETELRVKRLPRQRQEVADLEKKADACRNEIPFESDNTWLSRQINSIASETGVRDVSQRYLQTAPPRLKIDKEWEGKYDEKTWEIRMRCGYHELGRFLSTLEGVNRFLEVTNISIEGNEPGGHKVVLVIHYLVRKAS